MIPSFPTISIITPSLNQAQFLEQTILSIINQNYQNIEHIIVDGGSKDNTPLILERYKKNYNLRWISEPDNGQSNAINKGIKMSKGDIIGWINSDDFYCKNSFHKIAKAFNQNEKLDIIYGNCNYVNEKGQFLGKYPTKPYDLHQLINHVPTHITCQATFFKKEIFNKIGLFDENLSYAMDLDVLIRAGQANLNIRYISEDIGNFRKHKAAKTATPKARISQFKEILYLSRKYGGNYFNSIRIKYYRYILSLVRSQVPIFIKFKPFLK